jgi:hypothetical protein
MPVSLWKMRVTISAASRLARSSAMTTALVAGLPTTPPPTHRHSQRTQSVSNVSWSAWRRWTGEALKREPHDWNGIKMLMNL